MYRKRSLLCVAIVLAGMVLLASGCSLHKKPPKRHYSDSDFTEFDRAVLPTIFGMKAREISPGVHKLYLNLYYCSPIASPVEQKPLCNRAMHLCEARRQCMGNEDFRAMWRQAEEEIRNEVNKSCGFRCTDPQGTKIAYRILLKHGILHDIVAQAGPGEFTKMPANVIWQTWGAPENLFVHVDRSAMHTEFPPSITIFYYCTAARDFMVNSDPSNPYANAYRSLRRTNAAFRNDLDRVLAEFRKKAADVDHQDPLAIVEFTKTFHLTLMGLGLHKEIEAHVHQNPVQPDIEQ